MEWVKEWWWVWIIISSIVTWIFGYFIGPWFASRTTLRRELAATYLVPFRKWCADLYGELYEFKERYTKSSNLTPILIIIDYRELHDRLRDAPKWTGKIEKEKENEGVAKYLRELTELIDKNWHELQDKHNVNFETSEYNDDWIREIISCSKNKRDQISNEIEQYIEQKLKQKLMDEYLNETLRYLKKQIPKG